MENYTKGKNVEEELNRNKVPIDNIPEGFLWMQVKGGSKMPNLISYAMRLLQDHTVKVIVWSAAGVAIPKAISCSELIKRQLNIHNQVTRLNYKTDEEYWEPKIEGLETIVVKRQIPVIHIMLSVDDIADKNQLGYQSADHKTFWMHENIASDSKGKKYKKSNKNKNKR